MTLTVPVILGSVRSDRIGIRAARFLTSKLEARGHAAPLVDPAELKLPLLDRMYKEYPAGTAPEPLERLAALYRGSDAFLIVSAEYNHGVPPALSNTRAFASETTNTSLPAPPVSESAPVPPYSVSASAPPKSWSSPAKP